MVGASFLILLCVSVLLGWVLDIEFLKTVLPGRISMKANTALGFGACGLALWSTLGLKKSVGRLTGIASAIFVFFIGFLTLTEYLFHIDLRIDQLLFADHVQFPYPGRLAHITALNFCALGVALVFLSLSNKGAKYAQLLAMLSGFSALLAMVGYLYGVPLFYGSFHYTSMALHTGAGFLIVSLSILASFPEEGLMSVVASIRPAGWLARRLLLAAVFVPFALGLLGLYALGPLNNPRLLVAVLVVSVIVLLVALIWTLVSRLDRSEAEQSATSEALAISERMLRQSQKMEAVGLLAGGVAHDFNNLLSVIIGYSGLLLGGSPLPELQRKKVEKIKQAGDSAASLTRQLLAFSRQQVLQPEVLELHHIIEKMEDMLRRLINEDIEFSTSIAPFLMPIFADAGQVEQILINLCVNASDAMPTGGALQIEAVNVVLEEPFAAKAGTAGGRFVKLTVTDSGTGMDAETQAHIFEPFFTTKEAGKGTGLGLATVYGIVKQTGGLIEVDSKLGRGTSFHVYLPVADAKAQKNAADVQSFESPSRATVLVVEDSEPLRDLILETLEANGHNALIAEDGPKAIKICAQYSGSIELLLSDVVMPKMNGPEVLKRVKELRPNISVIFMSGYTNDVTVRHGITTAGLSFLQKPFTSVQLESAINEVLSRLREREVTRSRPNTDPRPTSSSKTRKV